jgi:predicted lipoprotein with Yx(FWY)xxD motif
MIPGGTRSVSRRSTAKPPGDAPPRRRSALVLTASLVVAVAGCGGTGTAPRPGTAAAPTTGIAGTLADGAASRGSSGTEGSTPSVDVARLVQVNDDRVLVDARGYPLYVYLPDHRRAVTCAAECAVAWPPVFVAHGGHVVLGPGVRAALVGTDPDPVGGTVVTYDHWPLYTYAGDTQPGFATGQGLDVDGGFWYLIRPDGATIVPAQ